MLNNTVGRVTKRSFERALRGRIQREGKHATRERERDVPSNGDRVYFISMGTFTVAPTGDGDATGWRWLTTSPATQRSKQQHSMRDPAVPHIHGSSTTVHAPFVAAPTSSFRAAMRL